MSRIAARRIGSNGADEHRDDLDEHFLHKQLDHHGLGSPDGPLPDAGKAVTFKTATSCLQVFSPEAALAAFTDSGAIHLVGAGAATAAIDVNRTSPDWVSITLTQHLVHVGPGAKPYILKAGTARTLRVGISIAPNRLPHPRRPDLRMFVWIGDDKNPYPSDREIKDAAQFRLAGTGTSYPEEGGENLLEVICRGHPHSCVTGGVVSMVLPGQPHYIDCGDKALWN